MEHTILVADDQLNSLKVMCAILEDEGYQVVKAEDGTRALALIEQEKHLDAVLADLKMPGMDGVTLYRRMKSIGVDIPFIIMTAHGSVESAVKAMKEGISNYLIKPLNYEELSLVLERAIREKQMSSELNALRREVRGKYAYDNIIGSHPSMKKIFDMVQSVAPTDAPVLIRGETGTGKELLAKAIHAQSRRSERPMVSINSAALTENLLESELFGHVRGAFTGATTNKKGRLEMADGGTLFLDEIGHMSLNLQTKLLRFLQEGTFEPVGGTATRYVNVRLITATNMDLDAEIKARRFLSDVLYRIEVLSLQVPPLRDRGEDVVLLANHFIKTYAKTYQRPVEGLSPEALSLLAQYRWPGNIRELENVIARSIILAKGTEIQPEDLPRRLLQPAEDPLARKRDAWLDDLPEAGIKLKDAERLLIGRTLAQCNGNKSKTAQLLGISRKTLYEKMERYGVGTSSDTD